MLLSLIAVCTIPVVQGTALARPDSLPLVSIYGEVRDSRQQPVVAAAIQLFRVQDSTIVDGVFTDDKGHFRLKAMPANQYRISVAYLGYIKYQGRDITVGNTDVHLPTIILQQDSHLLQEVTVNSKKPLVSFTGDNVTLNVENRTNLIGSTVFEILGRAPGLMTIRDNIVLNGKTDITVLIDGRRMFMDIHQATAYIKQLPAAQIKSIEIINSPSAKYDAAGSGGVINIVMKRPVNEGFNGAVNGAWNQGWYPRASAGINTNYRRKKWNLYGAYTFTSSNVYSENSSNQVIQNGNSDSYIDMTSVSHKRYLNNMARAGVDFQLNARQTIGVVANFSGSNLTLRPAENDAWSSAADALKRNIFYQQTTANNYISNTFVNVNYNGKFDSSRKELNIDVNGGRNHNLPGYTYAQQQWNDQHEPVSDWLLLQSRQTSTTDVASFRLDYIQRMAHKIKLDAGVKSSYARADNLVLFDTLQGGSIIRDTARSTDASYKEYINAAYVTFSKSWTRWDVQGGLRLEQTNATVRFRDTHSQLDINLTGLFPSLSVVYRKDPRNQFSLSFRKGTFRPSYFVMNPVIQYYDRYTYYQGNPELRPSISYSSYFSYLFKQQFNFTIGFSKTLHGITQLFEQQGNISKMTYDNLNESNIYSATVYLPFNITKWWEMTNNIQGFYLQYVKYDHTQFPDISKGNLTVRISTSNTFTLPRGITLDAGLYWFSPTRYNQLYINGNLATELTIRKAFIEKKLNTFITYEDIPIGFTRKGDATYNSIVSHTQDTDDARRIKAGFIYSFGNLKVKNNRQRKTGIEDEQNRIKSEQDRTIR
ncbi:outer membrane beta-barrel protein [Chitinophaga vietnamensis]|uniref:outer membrane beta-barrel protein n=1 Tax=Chitinophaga vietnamensis TaxID=2593957 RepID=UPI001177C80A|nr:outer membrane beta-barrel protein [Chitinophaga vietnamensis]